MNVYIRTIHRRKAMPSAKYSCSSLGDRYLHLRFKTLIFRSTPPSRPNKVLVSNVRRSVCPQKSFFDLNEIWHMVQVDEWCTMACSMTWFKVKVKVTSSWKSEIRPFSRLSPPQFIMGWQMTMDSSIRGQYLKLIGAGFLAVVPVYVSRDFEVGSK